MDTWVGGGHSCYHVNLDFIPGELLRGFSKQNACHNP